MYTPEIITHMEQNEIFVFGSNNLGHHAGGAAKIAIEKFGAIYGVPIGLQGNSYGIITTSFNKEKISIGFIGDQINVLYEFARVRPDLTFYVTKIGCGIAGWSMEEIAKAFSWHKLDKPDNVILPIEFTK